MNDKKVLLIAGGGTIGTYTARELIGLGYLVDVIALEHPKSGDTRLRYVQAEATDEFLLSCLTQTHYDAVVDFIHYPDPQAYQRRMPLLMSHTSHLIFLSSYRVYADAEHPVRETSPQLTDIPGNDFLLENDRYGVSKCREERILRAECAGHWTIVRPLISFSFMRFDMVTQGAYTLFPRAASGRTTLLPLAARHAVAGLGWAGNVGKMLARLVLNDGAYGEAFTLGSGETRTWDEIGAYYGELLGANFTWIDTEDYLANATGNAPSDRFNLFYDRFCDRTIDNAKALSVTGLRKTDFMPVKDALRMELSSALKAPDSRLQEAINSEYGRMINRKMDAYIEARGLSSK